MGIEDFDGKAGMDQDVIADLYVVEKIEAGRVLSAGNRSAGDGPFDGFNLHGDG
ncbi:hypothetical protein ES705_43360 [subsurface metagenome]